TERQAIESVQAMAEYIAAAQASIDRIPQLRAARLARRKKEIRAVLDWTKGSAPSSPDRQEQLPPQASSPRASGWGCAPNSDCATEPQNSTTPCQVRPGMSGSLMALSQ